MQKEEKWRGRSSGELIPQMELVRKRIDGLLQMIESKPKSSSWKLRAKIGPRKKWYEDVEEVIR